MEVNEIEDDNAAVGSVTYFGDDEGNCYYQPTMKTSLIQSITPLGNAENTEDMGQNDTQMLVKDEIFQTGVLVPTKTDTGEIIYNLIVQEDPQRDGNGNIDVQVDQQDKGNDECILNDKEEEDTGFTIEIEMIPHRESITDNSHKIVKNSDKLNISKLTCKLCNYTTPRMDLLLHHIKSHPDERPYKCCICQQCFKTLCSLHNHLNMHNDIKSKNCKYCHNTFTTSGELAKHVRYNHTFKKPHKCKECDYASDHLCNLQRHVRRHTGERPYPCPQCTYASADRYTLTQHLRTHTGEKPYKCDDCNMCFSQSNTLKSHKLVHNKRSEKKEFSCELCPATYGRKIHLRSHVKNLHTILNLKCKDCRNIFPDRYTWNIHNKTHESEKCFKCSVCPNAFTTSYNLKLHMVKHIGEKSFSCHECDQIFWQKQSLHRHQKIIHKPEKIHTCPECKRNYAHKHNLMRHLAVHDQKFSQQERPQNVKRGGQKLIERDQIKDIAKLGSNKEGSEDNKGEFKLDEEWNELKLEELIADGESADQLQYVVLVVDDLRLMDDEEQQIAPEYGKEEKQDEQSNEIHDVKTYQQQPQVLNRTSPHM